MNAEHDFTRTEEVRRWRDEFCRRFSPAWPAMRGGYERTAMAVDGYGASVMLAPRIEGEGNHRLPPGVAAPAYPAYAYEGCPSGWRRTADAFFVPIPTDQQGKGPGMWYDWSMGADHTHDLAVVPSTTGLNPITFQKADKLCLERYKDRCPVHDVEFEGDRFCQRCNDGKGLKWPSQNYVAAPNTLWWDGFRRPDGTVRQFWFSDDVLKRDVGVAVLGADRVPAFGFAFFRAKEAKPVLAPPPVRIQSLFAYPQLEKGGMSESFGGDDLEPLCSYGFAGSLGSLRGTRGGAAPPPAAARRATGAMSASVRRVTGSTASSNESAPPPPVRSVGEIRREAVERTVAVAAGSGIRQDLTPDPRTLDEWQTEPAAVITVYFVPEETAVAILQGPKRDLTGPREGALASIPVVLGTD